MSSELDELEKELADLSNEAADNNVVKKTTNKTLPILVAVFALLSFVAIVLYAYNQGVKIGSEDTAPLLTPDGMAKILPDDPGGLNIPHKDKLVFNRMNIERDDLNVERLLPPPEKPARSVITKNKTITEESLSNIPPVPSVIETPDPSKLLKRNILKPRQKTVNDTVADSNRKKPNNINNDKVKLKIITEKNIADEGNKRQPSDGLSKSWRIQISAVRSIAAAKSEWARQQKKHGGLLAKLELEIQKANVKGKIYYRVRGGPLKNIATAKKICAELKAKKTACIIVKPNG